MTEKAKIQYVGQFYIHGAAAPKLEPKRILRLPKTTLPLFRPNKASVRYFEPVAVVSIVVALALLLTMGLGLMQIREDWQEYQQMSTQLDKLRANNAQLTREYRAAYNLTDVESKALGLGLVPADSVTHITINVTPAPHVEPVKLSWGQEMMLFWTNLWE